jgi:hypothetical protein
MSCKGICIRHKAIKISNKLRYANGQKRCKMSFSGMVYIVLVVATGLGLDPGELSMDLDLKR